MNVSQKINHINENNYDDDITVTNVPKANFTAVTGNTYDPDTGNRNITVDLFPLDQSDGGTQTTNSGLYIRQEGEKAVTVSLQQDGKEIATNTQNYS